MSFPSSKGLFDFFDDEPRSFGAGTAGPGIGPPIISYTTPQVLLIGDVVSVTPTNFGDPVTSWTVSVGTLPGGLSLNAGTGEISGTTTTEEIQVVTIQAANDGGTDTFEITFDVSPVPPTNNSHGGRFRFAFEPFDNDDPTEAPIIAAAPIAPVISYTTPISLVDGTPSTPLSPTLISGDDPDTYAEDVGSPDVLADFGLTLNPTTGVVSGTPDTVGSFEIWITATNAGGTSDPFVLTFTVNPATPDISYVTPQSIMRTTPTSLSVTSIGGTVALYSVLSGTLPPGLTLNSSTGLISGIPSLVGAYTPTIRGHNVTGNSDFEITFDITYDPVDLTYRDPSKVYVGVAANIRPSLHGSTATGFSLGGGSDPLPAGLTLNLTTGRITGIPLGPINVSASMIVDATGPGGPDTDAFTIVVSALTGSGSGNGFGQPIVATFMVP